MVGQPLFQNAFNGVFNPGFKAGDPVSDDHGFGIERIHDIGQADADVFSQSVQQLNDFNVSFWASV